MTNLRKLQRDFASADLSAVSDLLNQLGEEDFISRISLEARKQELEEIVAEIDSIAPETKASAALYFSGKPVVGRYGIESDFGSAAVNSFQDLVAKMMAQEAGVLGQRGVVPNKSGSVLHIVDVLRGSFGFLLEEVPLQQQIVDTPLKETVDKVTLLLDAFGEADEEKFRSAVEAIDERVLTTTRDFFDLLRQNEATFRLVAGNADHSFSRAEVVRAAERAVSTRVEDVEELITGQLAGVLPEAHQFEFRDDGKRGLIRGKVDRVLSTDQLISFNREFVGVTALARVQIRRVLRNEAVVRETFALLDLRPHQND